MDLVVAGLSAVLIATLAVFGARRITLLLAALSRRGSPPASDLEPPVVAVIVPARNENGRVLGLLRALEGLDYPLDRLHVVAVNDSSEDETGADLERWAAERANATALQLTTHSGRSGTLNAGIAAAPACEVIAVCDADLRPRRDWLKELARCFGDARVGAAASYLRPANADANVVARYAALETWTHQLVTSAGKDRLDLNPPALGACAYRRDAIEDVGGFRTGPSPGDDVEMTAALTRRGWRTRFAESAVADNTVVQSPADYWNQHVRWGRNVLAADGGSAAGAGESGEAPPPRRRIEALLARSGYADRLALLAAVVLAAAGAMGAWIPAAYAAVVAAESTVAVVRGGQSRAIHRYLAAAVPMFAFDVAASAVALLAHVARRPRRWPGIRRLDRAPERA
jgi:GT2 family glycosyltransferase